MRRRLFAAPILTFLTVIAFAVAPAIAGAADGTWIPFEPGARMSHTLTADPERGRAIQFGGWDGRGPTNPNAFHNEVWALDLPGLRWSHLDPSGTPPTPRFEQVAVLDPTRDRMIVFGGKTATIYFGDLWALDLTGTGAWAPLAASGTPPPPIETRGVYDPVRDRILFFGGYDPTTGHLSTLWELSLAGTPTWSALSTNGTPPAPRRAHTMIYDPFGDRVIVFGGYNNSIYFGDVWQLSLAGSPTWTQLLPGGSLPPPRYGHSAMFDPVRLRMLVFGGFHDAPSTMLNDVWAFDLVGSPSWSQLALDGPAPLARDFSAIAYDEPRDRIVVNAGNTLEGVLGDSWLIDLTTLPTAVQVSAAAPDASPDRVLLRWQVTSLRESYEVFRTEGGTVWQSLGSARAAGNGILTWEDRDVRAGQSYSYRVHFTDEGVGRFGGEITVAIPHEFQLQLRAPALVQDGRLSVELTLPTPGDVRLEVFDLSGRRVFEQSEARDAGRHVVNLGSHWTPGVYWVRLDRGGVTSEKRVAILR